ncbi:hypothetical protein XM25_02810 [Devosia sp. H5989]|nr:hypothetical protein XM25_02810 [Devosia sp. H5989]
MPQASTQSTHDAPAHDAKSAVRAQGKPAPFFGLLDPIIVEDPAEFLFDGALPREHADHIWTWMVRDVAPDMLMPDGVLIDATAFEPIMPAFMARLRDVLDMAKDGNEDGRRLRMQIGGEESYERLPVALSALRQRALLEKAKAFGRATNATADEAALMAALQAMPLQDHGATALLMQAAVGQMANPNKLMAAVVRIAGAPSEAAVTRAGFGPLIDALLAHAQNQLFYLSPMGAFADIDLTCRALDRFHKLVRAINGYVEINRSGRWAQVLAGLTKAVSGRIEPKLREIMPDLNLAMRRRESGDRVDSDRMLSAISGIYLLATVRECRDSLALNAAFEQTWNQVGQALEVHINRNLDAIKANPADAVAGERLEAGIKMAELRFNREYADVLRRAREAAVRRTPTSGA